jgi:hypothetical protein
MLGILGFVVWTFASMCLAEQDSNAVLAPDLTIPDADAAASYGIA